jgi:hypothetical protein
MKRLGCLGRAIVQLGRRENGVYELVVLLNFTFKSSGVSYYGRIHSFKNALEFY